MSTKTPTAPRPESSPRAASRPTTRGSLPLAIGLALAVPISARGQASATPPVANPPGIAGVPTGPRRTEETRTVAYQGTPVPIYRNENGKVIQRFLYKGKEYSYEELQGNRAGQGPAGSRSPRVLPAPSLSLETKYPTSAGAPAFVLSAPTPNTPSKSSPVPPSKMLPQAEAPARVLVAASKGTPPPAGR